jgi:hypothetical protein
MTEEKVVDTADTETVKSRKRKLIAQQKQLDLDLYNLMNTSGGRNVIGRILSIKSPYSSSFCSDPYATAYNEGMRRISCILIDELMRVCPESYLSLVKETMKQDNGENNE